MTIGRIRDCGFMSLIFSTLGSVTQTVFFPSLFNLHVLFINHPKIELNTNVLWENTI